MQHLAAYALSVARHVKSGYGRDLVDVANPDVMDWIDAFLHDAHVDRIDPATCAFKLVNAWHASDFYTVTLGEFRRSME